MSARRSQAPCAATPASPRRRGVRSGIISKRRTGRNAASPRSGSCRRSTGNTSTAARREARACASAAGERLEEIAAVEAHCRRRRLQVEVGRGRLRLVDLTGEFPGLVAEERRHRKILWHRAKKIVFAAMAKKVVGKHVGPPPGSRF